MTLNNGESSIKYMISDIITEDGGIKDFLFTLGCYPGEQVSVISRLASNMIITVKNARYSIDEDLASAIVVNPQLRDERELVQKLA